jgi:type II secretory pathway pseudopilin PulG
MSLTIAAALTPWGLGFALLAWAGRRAHSQPPSRSLSSQHGSVLVEVLVGTILLALSTAAILDGLDGAQETGRKNRDRSAAATLAQQDLERMRALPPTVLADLDQTRTVTVASVPYTVVSRTSWIRDASGEVTCTTDETDAEYLKLSSTVTSPASTDAPVTATSLLTPPPGALGANKGTATVKLTDRDGEPLDGISVDLDQDSGTGFENHTTNEVGCAIFPFIDAGEWTAEVDGGLVTWSGEAPAESPVTVAALKTSLTQLELDVPASLRAQFVTPEGAAATWKSISVANAKLPSGVRTFTSATAGASRDATSLFPFHDGYGVYAGTCKANNPAQWDPDYFETSGGVGFASLDPGELLEPVQVVVPQIQITVTRSGAGFSQARVYVKERDTSLQCTAVIDNVTGTASGSNSYTSYAFTVPVPFGNYEVCAATRTTSNNSWRRKLTSTSAPLHRNMTTTALAIANKSVALDSTGSGSTSNQCDSTP